MSKPPTCSLSHHFCHTIHTQALPQIIHMNSILQSHLTHPSYYQLPQLISLDFTALWMQVNFMRFFRRLNFVGCSSCSAVALYPSSLTGIQLQGLSTEHLPFTTFDWNISFLVSCLHAGNVFYNDVLSLRDVSLRYEMHIKVYFRQQPQSWTLSFLFFAQW